MIYLLSHYMWLLELYFTRSHFSYAKNYEQKSVIICCTFYKTSLWNRLCSIFPLSNTKNFTHAEIDKWTLIRGYIALSQNIKLQHSTNIIRTFYSKHNSLSDFSSVIVVTTLTVYINWGHCIQTQKAFKILSSWNDKNDCKHARNVM